MHCNHFENTLHYSSPAHGDWGVVRIGMLIPESVQLFVCPFACGRHGAIGAMRQGLKERLFYLYVTESDIIDSYDDLIPGAVDEVLETLEERPKVFLVFVSCLDDLIGTDHDALLEVLGARHPDIAFRIGHMNPISQGSAVPPPVSIQHNLYSLLEETEERDPGVNSIGNLLSIAESAELHDFLGTLGHSPLRHISQYDSFSGYQEMAKSALNLVLAPAGKYAARQMELRCGTPFLFLPISYDLEVIETQYEKLREALCPGRAGDYDFSVARSAAEAAIETAKSVVKDTPILIDATAVMLPFGLARALLGYGFRVQRVEAQECLPIDEENLQWLAEHHPEVELLQPQHHKAVLFDRRLPDSIAIGINAAYLAGASHTVDLFADEGMFGYDGVSRLMALLTEAAKAPVDLEALIRGYGLVV